MSMRLKIQYLVLIWAAGAILGSASKIAIAQTEAEANRAQGQYFDCVKEAASQFLSSAASPAEIADAAQSKCDRELYNVELSARAYLLSVQSNSAESTVRANQMARSLAAGLKERVKGTITRLIIEVRVENEREARKVPAPTAPEPAPSRPPDPAKTAEKSSGTGFFVSRDGYIVTAAHVVATCGSLQAMDALGKVVPVEIARIMKSDDLALLKSSSVPKSFASFRSPARVNQGESVVAYGYPLAGLLASGGNVSVGLVAALSGVGDDARQIQISAPVQPGNSGGPLVDSNGMVVGVVVSKLDALAVAKATADIPQNINFAIKASSVINLLESSSVKYRSENAQRKISMDALTKGVKGYTLKIECN